jgi:hypothetical protein
MAKTVANVNTFRVYIQSISAGSPTRESFSVQGLAFNESEKPLLLFKSENRMSVG